MEPGLSVGFIWFAVLWLGTLFNMSLIALIGELKFELKFENELGNFNNQCAMLNCAEIRLRAPFAYSP